MTRRRSLMLLLIAAVIPLAWLGISTVSQRESDHGGESGVDDAPEARTWITGTVTRVGKPAAARVALHQFLRLDEADPAARLRGFAGYTAVAGPAAASRPPIGVVTADQHGHFEFALPGLGLYELHAVGQDGARTIEAFFAGVPGQRHDVRLHLPARPATLSGRVTHADGRPFSGVVELGYPDGASHWWLCEGVHATATGEGGSFRFSGIAPGRYRLWVTRVGEFRYPWGSVHLPHESDVKVRIPDAESRLHGRVIDDETQQPIAHARVVVTNASRRRARHAGCEMVHVLTADEDGRFESWLPSYWCSSVATAEGYAWRSGWRRDGRLRVIRLTRPVELHGRVVRRSDGAPVAGVPVLTTMDSESLRSSLLVPGKAISDADGRFVIKNVTRHVSEVVAFGNGWHSGGLTRIRWAPPGSGDLSEYGDDHLVEVEPTSVVRGVVRSHDGAPVPGAVVHLDHPYVDLDIGYPLSRWDTGSVATDRDGRFSIETAPSPKRRRLWCGAPGLPSFESEPITTAALDSSTMDLSAPAPAWVSVATRPPLPDAAITSKYTEGYRPSLPDIRTDQAGIALVGPLRKEDVTIWARPRGHGWIVGKASVPTAKLRRTATATDPITITMPSTREVRGRIEGPPGAPLHLALLNVRTPDWARGFYAEARVHDDGSFLAFDVPAEPLDVEAILWWRHQELKGAATVGCDGAPLVIRLEAVKPLASRRTEVRVLDVDGKSLGVASAAYHFTGDKYPKTFGVTVVNGVAILHHPPDIGDGWIEITELPTANLGAKIVGPFDAATQAVEVRLERGKTIKGRAQEADGRAVRGVRVSARAVSLDGEGLSGGLHASTSSDGDGVFELRGLGAGQYELRFECSGTHLKPDPITVRAGDREVAIEFPRASIARLRVLDQDGVAAAGLKVTAEALGVPDQPNADDWELKWRRGWMALAVTDARGFAVLDRLAGDRRFKLTIEAWANRDCHDRLLSDWTPTSETIRVERRVTTSGRAVGPDGKPLAVAHLAYTARQGSPREGKVYLDEEGAFSLDWLRKGKTLPLHLVLKNSLEESSGSVVPATPATWEIVGGTTEAVLRLDDAPWKLPFHIDGWTPPAEGSRVWAWLRSDQDRQLQRGIRHEFVEEDGTVVFRGLRERATYDLWIHNRTAGWYVLRKSITPQAAALELTVQSGGSIRGRIVLPPGRQPAQVRISAWSEELQALISPFAHHEEAFELLGLPDSRWTVRVTMTGGGRALKGEATVKTGGQPIKIELE